MSPGELSSGVNFLNFGITWDRAEKVFEQLAADKTLAIGFDELLRLHREMSAAIGKLHV